MKALLYIKRIAERRIRMTFAEFVKGEKRRDIPTDEIAVRILCNIAEAERFMAQYGRLFEFIKDELLTGEQYTRCLKNPATYRDAVDRMKS